MGSLFSKALVYLGLVDEDQAEQDFEQEPPEPVRRRPIDDQRAVRAAPTEGRRVEPPASAARTAARPEAGPSVAGVRPINPASVHADILVVEEFGDAKILADRVRDRVPVVMDFRRTTTDLTRRVVDFASGLIYALNGTMTKVGEGLVLVLPPNVTLTRDEKQRLASLGAYELDD